MGFPGGTVVKNPPPNAGDVVSVPGSGRSPGVGQPTPVFLPGKSHGQRSLAGYSSYGRKGSDMPEATWHAHFLNTNSSENTKEPMKPQNRDRNTLDSVALCHLA